MNQCNWGFLLQVYLNLSNIKFISEFIILIAFKRLDFKSSLNFLLKKIKTEFKNEKYFQIYASYF